jgi:tetratricopeptide (TPR) repeat protein
MPYALTSVFNALKKIHRFSPKYFDYAQQYNKHLAYTMALDKVEELLADFCKTLGEYLLSRDKKLLELLPVIKREMNNHAQLYESHHLKVYKNILDVSFALFVPLPDEIVNDEPIDDILIQTEKIIQQYPNDTLYASLKNIVTFLWFEYYHTLKIYKKAVLYYEILNVNLSSFLLYNFCTVPSLFLISKIDTALVSDSEETLWEDFKKLSSNFTSDTADIPNHINYAKFHAVAAFYSGRNDEAIAVLNELINDISFLSFPHAEIEVKLFLALCYICANKYDLSFYLVKNVQRKLRDMKNPEYENAIVFSKLLTLQMDFSHKHRVEKMFELRNKFISLNHGEMHMLEFIRLSDDFMKQLSKTGN